MVNWRFIPMVCQKGSHQTGPICALGSGSDQKENQKEANLGSESETKKRHPQLSHVLKTRGFMKVSKGQSPCHKWA